MSTSYHPCLASLLLRASEAEIGICVATSNPVLLRSKLYAEQKRLGIPPFALIQPPVGSESRLWIIKKEAKNGTTQD